MKKVTIKIYGKVQGVGFRYSAQQEAHKLNIEMRPHNEVDGSVFIEALGEEKALENFFHWCRKGPRGARVERIESEWEKGE